MALQVPFVRFDYERHPRHSNQNGSFYYVSTGGGLRENIGTSIDRGRGHLVYRRDYNFVRTYAAEFPLGTIDYFALLKRPRTPLNNAVVEYQSADSEHLLKRSRPFGMSDEVVTNLPVNILPVGYAAQVHGQSSYSSDDLPKAVVMTLNQGSVVKSMDFHPVQQILLLVGTNTREITLWELGSRKRLAVRNFKASLANDYTAPINRVIWSPDGTLFGVAYSKHVVHIYSYHGGDDVRNHLEIEAHGGSVNDLAFSYPNKQLSIVTCGDDRAIKVWDAVTGIKQYTFEGHEAPVYSVCTHHKENIQFIFSTATDGKIKAWLYDNLGSRVDYNAPGHSATTMAYSADGTRLFSCGTNKEGDSYLVEWNESEGAVKRTYQGLGKRSERVVHFDTTKNRFLAAGDKCMIKFWDMDSVSLLTTANAEGGLLPSPCIRFNKEGILWAVSTNDNGIKILANADGMRLVSPAVVKAPTLGTFSRLSIIDRAPSMASNAAMNGDSRSLADVKPRIVDESADKSRIWKLAEINEPSQCRSLRLPHTSTAMKVALLKFTGYKIINNTTDAGKAIIIICLAGMWLGCHSEVGWHALAEIALEHYGLEVDEAAITIYVCTVPVFLDCCAKLWLFNNLPRVSPKVEKII